MLIHKAACTQRLSGYQAIIIPSKWNYALGDEWPCWIKSDDVIIGKWLIWDPRCGCIRYLSDGACHHLCCLKHDVVCEIRVSPDGGESDAALAPGISRVELLNIPLPLPELGLLLERMGNLL